MKLISSAFIHGATIPVRYTCKGDDINPQLHIEDVPEGAKSLALILHDPDAVSEDWVHWLVWNIPADSTDIPEGALPADAVEGVTSFGRPGYGGPCPPTGTGEHRYIFELYALDRTFDLSPTTTREDLEHKMNGFILAEVDLIGLVKSD